MLVIFLQPAVRANNIAITDTCLANYDYAQDPANPLKIQFTDKSIGQIYNYYWDFGDGFYSEEMNPFHVFADSGTYYVCLTINSESKGCTDTHCDSITVPVPADCFTSFSAINDDEYPFKVFFTSFPGVDVESLFWTFGDGGTSIEWNPVHIYSDTGTYLVSLHAFNHHNPTQCNYYYRDEVEVKIDPCISDFHYTQDPYNPRKFNFYTLSTGNTNSLFWTFGDGRSSSLPNPEHIYADTGVFNVCLRISNYLFPDYCTDSICKTVTAKILPCKADFTYSIDSLYPLKVNFQNRTIGAPSIFQWSFGDGNTSYEINPNHNYPSSGDYSPCLFVYNSLYPEYCQDTNCDMINIPVVECVADFHYQLDSLAPLEVRFISDNSGIPDSYYWEFGDGGFSYQANPVHLFPDTGIYKVVLHIVNSGYPELCDDVETKLINLKLTHSPLAAFTYRFDSLNISPNIFKFTDISKTHLPVYWHWEFGDGSTTSTQHPVHQYAPLQNYKVCMTVTDFIPPFFLLPRTVCKTIQTHAYYDLGGSIFDSQYPINNPNNEGDTAYVELFRIYPNDILIPLKTGYFHHLGYYWFSPVLGGDYLVRAELTPTSRQAGKFFPTYALNKVQWEQANPVHLNQNIFDANVRLLAKPNIGTGPGSISGIVVVVPNPQASIGKPMMDVNLLLFNNHQQLLDFRKSGKDGRFSFDKLPLGTYVVIPDYPGHFYTTDTAVLNISNPIKSNILLKIWQNNLGTGISDPIRPPRISIYPNPASDLLILETERPSETRRVIEIYNTSGQMIKTGILERSAYSLIIDISGFPDGMYFIRMLQNNEIQSLKFIKN